MSIALSKTPLKPARPRRVYLMRHGEVSYFAEDGTPVDPRSVPLTPTGRAQAQAAQAVLAESGIERVFASPLPRTQETACLAVGGRLPVEVIDEFREIRAGRLRDIPKEQRRHSVANAYQKAGEPEALFLGGEGFADFAARVRLAWRALCFPQPETSASWSTILIVAHDAVNRVILADVLGCDLAVIERLEQDLAGVSMIDLCPGDDPSNAAPFVLRGMNITAHDMGKRHLRLTSMEWVASSL